MIIICCSLVNNILWLHTFSSEVSNFLADSSLHSRLLRPRQQRYWWLLTWCDEVCWNVNTPRSLSLVRCQHLQTSAELSPELNAGRQGDVWRSRRGWRTCDTGGEEGGGGEEWWREEVSGVTAGYSSSLLTDLMSRLYGRSALTGDN